MSLWLTEDELAVLTGYTQRSKQKVALALMRIEFKARAAEFNGGSCGARTHDQLLKRGRNGTLATALILSGFCLPLCWQLSGYLWGFVQLSAAQAAGLSA